MHLPWDDSDNLGQSIILPRSIAALSTAAPSRIVSHQGGPCFSFSPAAISQEVSVHVLRQRKERKFSPFETC